MEVVIKVMQFNVIIKVLIKGLIMEHQKCQINLFIIIIIVVIVIVIVIRVIKI